MRDLTKIACAQHTRECRQSCVKILEREKQISTEPLSGFLNGNDRGAGGAAQTLNSERYLRHLLRKK